jgi:hypothetical protein
MSNTSTDEYVLNQFLIERNTNADELQQVGRLTNPLSNHYFIVISEIDNTSPNNDEHNRRSQYSATECTHATRLGRTFKWRIFE